MQLSKQQIKQLQALQSDPRWAAIEQFLAEYIKDNFIQQTVKRDTEFNTIWELAHAEGGKFHIQRFFNQLEQEAMKFYD
jgi:hypothetical protein